MLITKIDYKKNAVIITIDDSDQHEFIKDVQGEFYLYVNKQLSIEELKQIQTYSAMIKHYHYTLRLLSKGMYAVNDIRTKLVKRDVPEDINNLIIERLLANKLLDDKVYATSLFNHYLKLGYGPLFIKHKLKTKKISEQIINELVVIGEETQIENAIRVAKSFAVKQKNIAKSVLLTKIYSKLTRDGYAPSLVMNVTARLKEELSDNDELALKNEYPKIKNKLSRKVSDEQVLQEEIIKALMKKGYRYEAIRKFIEVQKYVY